ncbi:MAG: Na/Pi cotransporter family protein [Firmicutes bacterium]|nr:Na/Pi cotransporter family protein [Bacillota bacterium]
MNMETFFSLLGGLGLFIYGMKSMGEGLQKATGDSLKRLLEFLTNNRILGVIVGVIVTALIQSSSATTVMVVGFVNAGLMTLKQATGVIMGANIGTTVTAQLIAFKLTDLALPAIGIGVGLNMFAQKRQLKYIGQILLGFGLLFTGMKIMEGSLKPIAKLPEFSNIMTAFSAHPILGVITGFLLTAVVQSSSATIGILQALAFSGNINLNIALPILFGDNIGTCVTALLSSMGANITAKRAALIHLFFNLIGTIIFLILLPAVIPIVMKTSLDPVRQIANAHTMFNIANTVIQLPFAGLLVALVTKLIPGQEPLIERGLKFLDKRLLNTPAVAFGQVTKEIVRMAKLAEENLKDSIEVFLNFNHHTVHNIYKKEEVINELEREITKFVSELSRTSLNNSQLNKITGYYNILNDIERVGDHAKNIIELAEFKDERNLPFSEMAINELNLMFNKVKTIFNYAIKSFETGNISLAEEVLTHEDEIDEMEECLRMHHIERLNKGLCYPSSGVIYLDIISNLERIGDHSTNIAHTVIDDF